MPVDLGAAGHHLSHTRNSWCVDYTPPPGGQAHPSLFTFPVDLVDLAVPGRIAPLLGAGVLCGNPSASHSSRVLPGPCVPHHRAHTHSRYSTQGPSSSSSSPPSPPPPSSQQLEVAATRQCTQPSRTPSAATWRRSASAPASAQHQPVRSTSQCADVLATAMLSGTQAQGGDYVGATVLPRELQGRGAG